MNKVTLTTYEIAQHCQVTPRTVIQWINEGKLKAYRTPGNHSRVTTEDFLAFLNKYNMPIPQALSPHIIHGKFRVLIVDDEKSTVEVIREVLDQEDRYELEVAFDGFEAGRKFAEYEPHLIVLDLNMPVIDGYRLCERIRLGTKNNKVGILVVSAVSDPAEVKRVLELGADDFLKKPFNKEELKSKIAALCGKARG